MWGRCVAEVASSGKRSRQWEAEVEVAAVEAWPPVRGYGGHGDEASSRRETVAAVRARLTPEAEATMARARWLAGAGRREWRWRVMATRGHGRWADSSAGGRWRWADSDVAG